MSAIESPQASIGLSAIDAFHLVHDPTNLASILSEEHVQSFHAEGDACQFKVVGGLDIFLKRSEAESPSRVRYASQKGTPVRFHLDILIEPLSDQSCAVCVRGEADLNPFMRMVAEKPLQQIFDALVSSLEARYPL